MKSIPALCLLITVLMSVKAQSAAGGGGSHEEGDGPSRKSHVRTVDGNRITEDQKDEGFNSNPFIPREYFEKAADQGLSEA